ncbi:sugar ABC transporter substrate-binding protein [Aliifodinibius sp. S!AR15-10]|uniref:sugar ABC transporter substrate-binding protein n=1 Tax=Aliifodinibius sp. S!AR15-10 TaxID=2950437 RepID=UPI002864DE07|nr:sugar ABC transporter substrate-binding protein [Aliifodinibius sp. S!AR15-10]MDR8391725.1 sugar ABC transporter substrate-binding protein [Aliifodinibius sp. S!AR15-10]
MKFLTLSQQLLLSLVACILLMFSSGCNSQKFPGKPTVALVVKTLNNPFFNDMEEGALQVADSLELNLLVQAAEREVDVEKQVQIIENLIQRRVDAILLTPSGSSEVVPVILKANNAGIPIINLDTKINMDLLKSDGGQIATYIGSDNYEGGRLAGRYLVEQLGGKGKVAILEGIPGHETADSRQKGFLDGIAEAPGIQVVTSQPANWERNMGYTVFQNILQSHSDLNAVFAANDLMALGAVEAIAASGKNYSDIIVVGFDAHSEAIASIRNGEMDATIAQNPVQIGRMGVLQAYKLLNGGSVPEEITVQIKLIAKESLTNNNIATD